MVKPLEYSNKVFVLIGCGEEKVNDNLVKFWIRKNTSDDTWGEKNCFRMKW
jgi:hypothetical protein